MNTHNYHNMKMTVEIKPSGQYEAGREAAIKAAQNIANACNLVNIHPCDMGEVTRLCEEAKDLRIKAAKLGFTTTTL